jgi:dihydroneopterin aldolase
MTIHIEALTFEVIIGLLDFEREKPQRIRVDASFHYTYNNEQFIDYATIVEEIQTHMHQNKYALLEEALLGLEKQLLALYPTIEQLQLKITKLDIFPNCCVALSNT